MAPNNILVVDSSLSVRVNIQHALMAAGFQVTACEGGAAARKAARKQPFSLVITEAELSDVDGRILVQEIRAGALGPKAPVVMISSDGSVAARLSALAAGAIDYIGKPIGAAFIAKRVRQLIETGGPSSSPGPIGSHSPARILLVDDSETFLNAFADRVRAEGHDVVLAKSGAEALSFLDAQTVDGIVLDLFMPGLSGLETCRRIRSAPSSSGIPILLLTGREDSVARAAGVSAGADEHMVKSTDMTAMAARLGEVLRRARYEHRAAKVATRPPDSPRSTARLSALLAMASSASSEPRAAAEQRAPDAPDRDVSSSVPPPPSSDPPRSSEGPQSGPYLSPLFEQVLNVSGLQLLIGRGCLRRAFDRAGVDPRTLTVEGLDRAMPEIRQTLSVFLPKEEAERHGQAIAVLLRRSAQSSSTLLAIRNSG